MEMVTYHLDIIIIQKIVLLSIFFSLWFKSKVM